MKLVTLSATFPELRQAHQGQGKGSSRTSALSAAIRNLLKNPKLKCKRFKTLNLTVCIADAEQVEEVSA